MITIVNDATVIRASLELSMLVVGILLAIGVSAKPNRSKSKIHKVHPTWEVIYRKIWNL